MKLSAKVKTAVLITTLGAATITLFQNCSAGSLPDMNTASSTTAAAVNVLPLVLATAPSVVADASTLVSVSGGTGSYHFTTTGGTVTLDPILQGYTYTAPDTPNTYIITVTDDASVQKNVSIIVTAKPDVAPPVVVATSKPVYEFYDASWGTHSYSDVVTYAAGASSAPKYRLVVDGSTGAVPFYRCAQVIPNVTTYFDTTHADCEGLNTTAVQIGFIYLDGSHANTVPLYRYRTTVLGWYMDHVDSLNAAAPSANVYNVGGNDPSLLADVNGVPWLSDGPMGYVPTN